MTSCDKTSILLTQHFYRHRSHVTELKARRWSFSVGLGLAREVEARRCRDPPAKMEDLLPQLRLALLHFVSLHGRETTPSQHLCVNSKTDLW